ncbi:PAS domain S-box protein [Deinococcus hohokamensis]|uniref:PAS domain S-box protein n=1 Tax=Deinococcus hohokamensis TaxID=309883 RepID=A0ABV9I7S1_9DEIO
MATNHQDPFWVQEQRRRAAVDRYAVLDTPPEAAFDRIVHLAARLFGVPLAAVTFFDGERQWFKACVGADIRENTRGASFCGHLIEQESDDVLVVPDAREDERYRDLAVVTGAPHLRFYAGAPLLTPDGVKIGTLCLYDFRPRDLSAAERRSLSDLAAHVVSELELRQAVALQARARKILAAVLASAMDGMVVLNQEGRVTEWNPAAESMLGYSRDLALGRELTDVMVPPEFHEVHRRSVRLSVEQSDRRKRRVEVQALRRDGVSFPCEFTVTPFDVDGETMFMVYLRDLTEVHAAQDALTSSHTLLRTVVDSVPESIYVKDRERRYTMINAAGAAQIGLPASEILGRTDDGLFPQASATASRQRDEAVLSGHTLTYEVDDLMPSGEQRTFWSTKVPIPDVDGTLNGLVGVAVDITQRKAAETTIRAHNDILTARVETAQMEILERLAKAAEYRDDDTGEHMHRVGRTAAGIARELGLSPVEVDLIERTAPLHDVGKIGVPDSILLKPGRLTPDEFEVVKTHALIGANILSGGHSPVVVMAEEIARTHHERWDGSGYPSGLCGKQIPQSGRIVAVADVLDALMSERPYKHAWSLTEALNELRAQAGRHFDPDVVAALERFLNQDRALDQVG